MAALLLRLLLAGVASSTHSQQQAACSCDKTAGCTLALDLLLARELQYQRAVIMVTDL